MNNFALTIKRTLLASLCFAPGLGFAFNSGSTGTDGAFSPTVNTQLQLPESGVFNFTTVNIPTGVTVTFKKNTTNTPVVFLASGNVTIAGSIDIRGQAAPPVGAAGNGSIGDDGLPGTGGPGGYDGGRGGQVLSGMGGSGLGPGGGGGANVYGNSIYGGGGAGFASSPPYTPWGNTTNNTGKGGVAYGSAVLLPLIGGSGGGGGAGGASFSGSGGGGGGGAILIASSGIVNVTGSILANGATGGDAIGSGVGSIGGGGSGGAIRIVATTISGNGTVSATGPAYFIPSLNAGHERSGGAGSEGRIRLEAETFTRTAASNPVHSFSLPGPVFIAGLPTLTISSVAGVAAPASPTGNADITLPANTPNPVTVVFKTTGVPVGNTIKLTITPANAAPSSVVSPALSGTTESATASVTVTLPSGPSVMSATTTYTIVAALGDLMSMYAQGERVEKITLAAVLGGQTKATLITVSGKEFAAPAAALALAGIAG